MAISLALSDSQRLALREGFDSLIGFFGKTCKLVYKPILVDCTNCNRTAINTYTNTVWSHGGPLRVDQQGCVYCGGTGKKAQEQTDNIVLSIAWLPKDFIQVPAGIVLPAGTIQSRGYLTDLPKVQQAIEMQAQVPIENYTIGRYKLNTEAFDAFGIVQERYFIAFWNRIA